MHHLILLTIGAIILTLGQGSLFSLPVSPNTTLIIVTYVGQFYSPVPGLFISFILGYSMDIVSGTLIGLNSFAMVSLCYISFMLGKRVVMQSGPTQTVMVFIFCMIYSGIVLLLFKFFNIDISHYDYLKSSFVDGLATALISPILISGIKRMERFLKFVNERDEDSRGIKI